LGIAFEMQMKKISNKKKEKKREKRKKEKNNFTVPVLFYRLARLV
jgi:glutaredoxin